MSFKDRHFPGMPFTIGGICCSALGVIPIHTFMYVKKDREDMGEKSKKEMSKLVLTDSLKFIYLSSIIF